MPDRIARVTSLVGVLLASGSFFLSVLNYTSANEQIDMEVFEGGMSVDEDSIGIRFSGSLDLYNESTRRVTVINILSTTINHGRPPTASFFRLNSYNCDVAVNETIEIEPRASVRIPFSCFYSGGETASQVLAQAVETNRRVQLHGFLEGLFEETGADFFDRPIIQGFSADQARQALANRRWVERQPHVDSYTPIEFIVFTRSGRSFRHSIEIFIGPALVFI